MNYALRTLKLILTLLLLPFSTAFADTVTTPFNIELSVPSTLALLGGISSFTSPSGQLKTDLPDQSISSPFPVTISGIHLTLNYAFDAPTASAALNEWNIQSKNISASVVIDAISTTQTVVEKSGATTLTLQVTASCSDVQLQLIPGATQMNALVDLSLAGNQTSYSLKNFSANWTPSAWQVTSMNCQGPAGFPDQVKQAITTQLETINPFLASIQTQIQSQIAKLGGPVSWTMAATDTSGLSIHLVPQDLSALPSGAAIVSGTASFDFSKLENTKCQKTITDIAATPTAADTLVVPISTAESLVECVYLSHSIETTFTSKAFPAFQSLLKNWFEKLIVWPSLLGFNSREVFDFSLSPTAEPVFGPMSAGEHGAFLFNLNASLNLQMDAPEASGPVPYLNFPTTLSGPATLTIQDGYITFRQNPSVLNVSPQWAPTYLDQYHPDTTIKISLMEGYLRTYLTKTGLSYILPHFESPGAFSLSINSATVNGSSANIALGITALEPKTTSSQTQ